MSGKKSLCDVKWNCRNNCKWNHVRLRHDVTYPFIAASAERWNPTDNRRATALSSASDNSASLAAHVTRGRGIVIQSIVTYEFLLLFQSPSIFPNSDLSLKLFVISSLFFTKVLVFNIPWISPSKMKRIPQISGEFHLESQLLCYSPPIILFRWNPPALR